MMLRYLSTAISITFYLVVACVLATAAASAQDINTIAGRGAAGFAGDGGPALAANLHEPGEIAVAPDGTIFFVDLGNVRIRRIRPSGIIDTVAGSGRIGAGSGDGGPAIEADFGNIYGIAVHAATNSLYVSDSDNSRIRRIDLATGIISTFAGTGVFGYTGDGAAANDAALAFPLGLTLDDAGNLFVVDQFNCLVRRVDAATGIITTVAGLGDFLPDAISLCDDSLELPGAIGTPLRVAVDRDNNLYVLSFRVGATPVVRRIDLATRLYTTVFEFPEDQTTGSLTVRSDGHLFVASETRIFQVDPDGTDPVVVAGSLVYGFAGDGGPAVNAVFGYIGGLAFTPSGALLVSDSGNNRIRAIGPPPGVWAGDVTVVGTNQTNITLSGVTTVTGSINISHNPVAGSIDLGALTTTGGDVTITGNGAAGSLDLGALTSTGGDVTITGNSGAGSLDLGALTTTGGDVTITGNGATGSLDLGALTSTGGDVTITGNSGAGSLDLGALTSTGGDVTVTANGGAGSLDLGALTTTGGDVTITANGAAGSIDLAALTAVAGDLTIDSNGTCTNVVAGSVTSVTGNLDVESCGTGSFTIGSPAAGGDATITTSGYTSVTGTTAVGSTTVTNITGDARMTAVIQSGSFVTPVTFAITRLEPLTLLPEIGLTPTGSEVMLDPIAAYEIAFEVPVLNREATLTFDVYPASLDAATRDAFLAALATGEATIATRSEAGSRYQTFPICGELETPSAGGCVRTEMLDGNGQPTDSAPAIVRFSNVVGHFSTWAVVIPTAEDTTAPAVTPIISGTLGANGWYVGDVSFYWDVRDDESPVTTTTGCEGASVTSDSAGAIFTCTATSAGGTASGSVTIKRDATPPQSALPADITVEATGPSGATATYAGSVVDNLDPSPVLACAPASGSVFPVGTTGVNCTSSDVAGNSSAGSFRVGVVDTTPPVLVVPGDLSVDAVNPAGASVSYLPVARDVVDATPKVGCQPASGSVFPIGTTVVSCTATDHSGNAATGTFNIRVRSAVEQIVSLIDKTRLYLDLPLLEAALKARLEEAVAALLQKSTVAACRAVNLYIAAVPRMPSGQLSAVEKSELIADADRIKVVIGCR